MPDNVNFSCELAAANFQRWAFDQGLLTANTRINGTTYPPTPITDQGLAALRARGVLHVGFNEVERTVTVFLRRAAPKSKKALEILPQSILGYAINYQQGIEEPIGPGNLPLSNPPFHLRQVGQNRIYTCGSSISVGNMRDAGTVGCLVHNNNHEIFGLSNNHVTGSCNYAQIGMPIVAPGIADVVANGLHPFTLGVHAAALTMLIGDPSVVPSVDNYDAAIFRILDPALISSYQGSFYDTPNRALTMLPGMEVEKVGRTTALTRGRVISQIFGPVSITYNASAYNFQGGVFFEPMFIIEGAGGLIFSDFGDSGSLITSIDSTGTRHAVGLVVGSMNSGNNQKLTLAAPIEPILQKLNVSLLAGHNV